MAKRLFLIGFRKDGLSFEAVVRGGYTRVSVKNRTRETLEQQICTHGEGDKPPTVLARLRAEWLNAN